jgi:hypothetical protein
MLGQLENFSLLELHGLVYQCRTQALIAMNDERVDDMFKWASRQGACYSEFLRRGAPVPPPGPAFQEELRACAALLKRIAEEREYPPDEDFAVDRHRAILGGGLTIIFTRHRNGASIVQMLSVSGPEGTVAAADDASDVIEAFWGSGKGDQVFELPTNGTMRIFVKEVP